MKRAVIVHCWGGSSNYAWYQNTKKELEEKGYSVQVPNMPETDTPKLSLWLPKLAEVIGIDKADEELVLIGHSAGVITILRYLEQLPQGIKINTVIMVAGFTGNLGFEELKNFFTTPIDFEYIKTKAKKFIGIFSDNDQYVSLVHSEIFKEKLGAKIIIKHAMNHFSGTVDSEESCTKLSDVAARII